MRISRRLGLWGSSQGKYVWQVYNVVWGADESTTPYTGSFTLSVSSRYKMVSTTYTATSSRFTLTNWYQTARDYIEVGDYLVDVSTSSSQTTSGSYLYKITSISGGTFSYIRWAPSQIKGTTVVGEATSSALDYPINGLQDGYWYVLMEAPSSMPRYTWDVYGVSYKEVTSQVNVDYEMTVLMSGTTWMSSTQYTYDPNTGLYTLKNPKSITILNATTSTYFVDVHATTTSTVTSGSTLWKFVRGTTNSFPVHVTYTQYDSTPERGSTKLDTVSAFTPDYPENGEKDGRWYVLVESP